jgi:fumarate hydratase class II
MHIAVVLALNDQLYPALEYVHQELKKKSEDFSSIYKRDQTYLQDAVPMTSGQEFSAYTHQIAMIIERLKTCELRLYELPIGGTAVGTGINTSEDFGKCVAKQLKSLTRIPFIDVSNKFQELNTYDIMVELSSALNTLASSLSKIKLVHFLRLLLFYFSENYE